MPVPEYRPLRPADSFVLALQQKGPARLAHPVPAQAWLRYLLSDYRNKTILQSNSFYLAMYAAPLSTPGRTFPGVSAASPTSTPVPPRSGMSPRSGFSAGLGCVQARSRLGAEPPPQSTAQTLACSRFVPWASVPERCSLCWEGENRGGRMGLVEHQRH